MHEDAPGEPTSGPSEPGIDYISIPITAADGGTIPLQLPLEDLWRACRAAETLELDETLDLIRFGWKLLSDFLHQGITNPDRALAELAALLADPLTLTLPPAPLDPETQEASLLRLCYKLLQEQHWSSAEAAAFASQKLGRSISSDMWWERIGQWAAQHSLPPLT